jgi:hypothetical protein
LGGPTRYAVATDHPGQVAIAAERPAVRRGRDYHLADAQGSHGRARLRNVVRLDHRATPAKPLGVVGQVLLEAGLVQVEPLGLGQPYAQSVQFRPPLLQPLLDILTGLHVVQEPVDCLL